MPLFLQLPVSTPQIEVTDALAEAIAEATKLPAEDQNYLAFRIMEDITEEQKWSDSFTGSLDTLDKLVAEAREDIAAGRVCSLEDFLAEGDREECKA